ncbi:hypothetical protein ACWDTI_26975 [Gordonia sp. NPDC003424]
MTEEPSILASLGVDTGPPTPPPPQIWESALQAAFDPASTADADTVPYMDDTPPPDDDHLVVDEPVHDVSPGHAETASVDHGHVDAGHVAGGDGDSGVHEFDEIRHDDHLDHGPDDGHAHDHGFEDGHGHDDHPVL